MSTQRDDQNNAFYTQKRIKISLLYIVFSILATLINLGTQALTSALVAMLPSITYFSALFAIIPDNILENRELILSMLAGTFTGLVVKYHLDKRFIFQFIPQNTQHNANTFMHYTGMGVVTTAIFWLTEFAFDVMFGTLTMRYFGAVIGLSIGYLSKYQLDKHYVFVQRTA